MTRSRWVLLLVLLLIVAVSVAKQGLKSRSAAPPAARPAAPAARQGAEPLPGSALDDCLQSGRPTVADFGKVWCVPCKMMVPVLKQAAQDYRGEANVVFVNLDDYGHLGMVYRIATMPTQIFFDARGAEVGRHVGYLDNAGIDAQFARLGLKK